MRILIHVFAMLLLVFLATLVASPPSDGNAGLQWFVQPWEQIANTVAIAVVLQTVAVALVVLWFSGDRRTLRVGLLVATAVVASVINSIVLSIIATVTTTVEIDTSPFALALFLSGLAGMVFVVAAALAATLAEYALLPRPQRGATT